MIILVLIPNVACAHLHEGLVGWWRLDEGTGTSAMDSSGQGNTQTLTLTPTWATSCARGQCLYFDGVYAHTQMAQPTVLNLTTFSLSAWVKPEKVTGDNWIVGGGSSGGTGSGYGIMISSSKAALDVDPSGGGNTPAYLQGATTLVVGRWYHIVGTYDGVNGQVFLNGVSDVAPTARGVNGNPSKFSIGAWISTGFTNDVYVPFKGYIDDARVYNRVLTDREIADLYKAGAVIYGAVISGAKINQ